ncbi:hypothetical protein ACP70R_035667 [Stipagrostis hirtigluma subsp. patula]
MVSTEHRGYIYDRGQVCSMAGTSPATRAWRHMLSHAEVVPVAAAAAARTGGAAGIKLFGKVITTQQPAHHAGADADGTAPTRLPPPQASGRGSADLLEEAARARAAAAEARLPCPRCRSRDTKFCYFNNYNLNQPRHFCRACHRYWTAGGALRNVPVGSGRRKNRPVLLPPAPPHAGTATPTSSSDDHRSGSGSPSPVLTTPGFYAPFHVVSTSHAAPPLAHAAGGLPERTEPRWWLVTAGTEAPPVGSEGAF